MAKVSFIELAKRGCLSRWFGPLTPGSMRGSIFALMQTALGAGILSLPYVFKTSGVLVGTTLLIISCYLSYVTMKILVKAAFRTGKNNYAEIVHEILGAKAGFIIDLTFCLSVFGVATLYFIVGS